MSQNKKPYIQYEFSGVDLSGNPLTRPIGSAFESLNVRIMPGNRPRLKSGRKARRNLTNATAFIHMINAGIASNYGNDYALALVEYVGSKKVIRISLADWTVDETGLETINQTFDTYVSGNAHTVLQDSVIFDNGLGVIDVSTPKPSLTRWKPPGTIRYFGLDCKVSGSAPTVAFNSGGSGLNEVNTSLKLYVGLYWTGSGVTILPDHYSNTIYLGELTNSGGTGYIRVSGLNNIVYPTHGAAETAELYWVFYATIDGFQVPYLLLNSTLDGPFKSAVSNSTVDLDILSGTVNGWVLDTTKEMPTSNYPPRRMRSICYANGRNYGILSPNSNTLDNSGHEHYKISSNELSSVVWSDADGSVRTRDYIGDPLQSWPLSNGSVTPSGERPLVVTPAPNLVEVLVFTATRTFILREQADGIHDWDTISNEHGLDPQAWYKAVAKTRHGIVWVTQNKQLAIYTNEGEFKILSSDYDALAYGSGLNVSCILYVYDPINLCDQVHVFRTTNSYVHDFNTGAWSTSEPHYVNGAAVLARQGVDKPEKHFVIAASSNALTGYGLYTIGGQVDESGAEITYDELFTGASGQTKVTQEVAVGSFSTNWITFDDPNLRKEIPYVDIIGDADSYSGGGASGAILLNWSAALDDITQYLVYPFKCTQEGTGDHYWRFKISAGHRWAWRFRLLFYSHYATTNTYPIPGNEGALSSANFYGSVAAMLIHVSARENRL